MSVQGSFEGAVAPIERPRNNATGESAVRPHIQLDIFEAMRRRDSGQDLVCANSDADYREKLSVAIRVLAASGKTWCSDDLRQMAGDPPTGYSPNLVGALINHALRSGLIHTVSWTRSARVAGHGNLVGLYVGVRE